MKMLIMGAPGSGKGTQSEILSAKLNIPAISTGAMLREAMSKGTEVGKEAAKYINEGKLVPDETIINVVIERVAQIRLQKRIYLRWFSENSCSGRGNGKVRH